MSQGESPDLYRQVGDLSLPVALVDLDELVVRAISSRAVERIGLPASEIVGHPMADLMRPEHLEQGLAALRAIQTGAVDFYRTNRKLRQFGPEPALTVGWVRRVEFPAKPLALIEATDDGTARTSPLVGYLGFEPGPMAIGTLDPKWRILTISSEVRDLLGLEPAELTGSVLLGNVRQHEIDLLLDAGRRSGGSFSAGVGVHLRDRDGNWKAFCMVLTSLSGPDERLFILTPADGDVDTERSRADKLERLLWSIAGEIEASGVLQGIGQAPDLVHLPEARALSTRQWEILTRLARGERVPTIAEELFLSQSTVRNHVSAILSRFGVKSQAELLSLLRKKDRPPV